MLSITKISFVDKGIYLKNESDKRNKCKNKNIRKSIPVIVFGWLLFICDSTYENHTSLKYKFEPMPILYQASPHMKAIKLASRMYNTHFSSSRYWFLCKSPMPILYQAIPHMKAIKFSIQDV